MGKLHDFTTPVSFVRTYWLYQMFSLVVAEFCENYTISLKRFEILTTKKEPIKLVWIWTKREYIDLINFRISET